MSGKSISTKAAKSDRGDRDAAGDARALVGNEPPLTLTENSRAALKSGSVSWRWLSGAFITGICGAGLIGGALMTSVDGAIHFTEPMQSWGNATSIDGELGLGDRNSSTAKSDKLDLGRETQIARKVIQITEERQVGQKEFISIRPYELVTIPIATTVSEISKDLPAFNPLKIFADGGVFATKQDAPEPTKAVEAEAVAVETRAFAEAGPIAFDDGDALSEQDIAATVQVAAPFDIDSAVAYQSPSVPTALTAGGAFEALSSLSESGRVSAALEPSNETVIAKTPAEPTLEDADSVSIATIAPGDTLSSLLAEVGIDGSDARVIAQVMRPVYSPSDLQPGQQIHFAVSDSPQGKKRLVRLSLFRDGAHLGSVRQGQEAGTYIALDASAEIVRPVITAAAAPAAGARASIYKGLFESGIRQNIPRDILGRIVQVHSYDVDFQRPVQNGDHFSAFFELPGEDGAPADPLPFYISLTIRGEGRGFYKFRTPDDGVIDYYDGEGRSAKKFLIRKPVNGGKLRSGFGLRRHPVLRIKRMHKGVDWAAPRGTPIVAAGNGTVLEAKWKSGYGNWVKLRHANGYETNYGHMTRRAKGLKAGQRVRQGQVIGYVGSTGLSTGPHLHYEVEVNRHHVDPLRIRLPRGRVLEADMLTAFQKQKTRIDALMARPAAKSTVARSERDDVRQVANR